MTPLLPAQAFGMTSLTIAPSGVAANGGRMMMNVVSARMAAMMASQPSASTYLYVMASTAMTASTENVPPATAFRGIVQSLPKMPAMNSA